MHQRKTHELAGAAFLSRTVPERCLVFRNHCSVFGVLFGPGSVWIGPERMARLVWLVQVLVLIVLLSSYLSEHLSAFLNVCLV